jgi:hypothetical protein
MTTRKQKRKPEPIHRPSQPPDTGSNGLSQSYLLETFLRRKSTIL